MERKNIEKVTGAQKVLLLDFMETHTDFASDKLIGGTKGNKNRRMLSTQLAVILNNDGPTKVVKKWQRVWTDLKNKSKRKAAKIAHHTQGTGGGPQLTDVFSDIEERILNILSREDLEGIEDHGFPQNSEEPREMEVETPLQNTSRESTTFSRMKLQFLKVQNEGVSSHKMLQKTAVLSGTLNAEIKNIGKKFDQLIKQQRESNEERKK
ncbi:hypothetical protein RN001_007680 [Aquatica leii]|uniref:Uncharacterized protein n=1 Tax=Aquatica leii TaxID=1421715 RepID=A0AAN7P939_9COLE|nr:hypothetical protein RN001_007680 [Aquatica leii]